MMPIHKKPVNFLGTFGALMASSTAGLVVGAIFLAALLFVVFWIGSEIVGVFGKTIFVLFLFFLFAIWVIMSSGGQLDPVLFFIPFILLFVGAIGHMWGVISLAPYAVAQPLQWYSNVGVEVNFKLNATPLFLVSVALIFLIVGYIKRIANR